MASYLEVAGEAAAHEADREGPVARPRRTRVGSDGYRRIVDRAGPGCAICLLVGLQNVVVYLGQEGGVEPVGDLGEANVEADLDHLLDREVLGQGLVSRVVDAQRPGRPLRVANDRRLGLAIHPGGQWVVTQVLQLLLADP